MSIATEEFTNPDRNSRAREIRRANGKVIQKGEETFPKETSSVAPVQPLTKGGYRVAIGKAPDRGSITGALTQAAETLSKVSSAPSEGITPLPPLNREGSFPVAQNGVCQELGLRVSPEDVQRFILKQQKKGGPAPA